METSDIKRGKTAIKFALLGLIILLGGMFWQVPEAIFVGFLLLIGGILRV